MQRERPFSPVVERPSTFQPITVYWGMRVLCVGRHAYLAEHLCRLFGEVGAECEPAVGGAEALRVALAFEPQLAVCEGDLLTPAMLVAWTLEPTLAEVPVLAVTLTCRSDDQSPATTEPVAAVYLPGLDRAHLSALLTGVPRSRGVTLPFGWSVSPAAASAHRR